MSAPATARLWTLQITLVPDERGGPFPDLLPLEIEKALRGMKGVIDVRDVALVSIPDPRKPGPRPDAGFY